MSMPGSPGASRGQPAFDHLAQDAIAATRGPQQHWVPPPEWELPAGYQRAELTDEERAEAEKNAADEARICRYCIGIHKYPTSIGCPRIAEATLNGEGAITSVKFWPGTKWADRLVKVEELYEEAGDGGH